jgi:formate dehydrogenase subunit gamma
MDTIRKYTKTAIAFHWIHTTAFLLLVVTGIILFVAPAAFLAAGSWTRVVHRIAAVVFMLAPLLQLFVNRRTSAITIKKALSWGKGDLDWLMAAPRYYFLSDESAMIPQDEMNTGQKLWFFLLLVFSPIFIITGALMWFFKDLLPQVVLQYSVFFHDVAFIVITLMFMVHIYLGVIHPLMRTHGGSLRAMVKGSVTNDYAKSHHGKWFEENKTEQPTKPLH